MKTRDVVFFIIFYVNDCFLFKHNIPQLPPYITIEDLRLPYEESTTLNEEDFKNGELLKKEETVLASQILPQQKYYKGDIRGRAALTLKETKKGLRRNGVTSVLKKWPNGRIPYIISTEYNQRERAVLAKAFQEYHTRTCIRFSPKTPADYDYLYIGKIDGCYSDVGRAGGRQEVSLDDGCLQYDTAIHELMHSVGFYHEHERWDRDNHITILWKNIDREAYDQFEKADFLKSSPYGQPYDYYSILHYDSYAFTKNGFETLLAKRPELTRIMGKATDFSLADITKINLMYSCDMHTSLPLPQQPEVNSWNLIERPQIPNLQVTGDTVCEDRSNVCYNWLHLCHSPLHQEDMKELCARSCGFCIPSSNAFKVTPYSPDFWLGAKRYWIPKIYRKIRSLNN